MFVSRLHNAGHNHEKNPSKVWQSTNIWERHEEIEIAFTKKLKAHCYNSVQNLSLFASAGT
jgi:hypothetical protein